MSNEERSERRAGSARPRGGEHWSEQRAEGQLRSLELFGMRFGLDRMRRMMTALGSPERAFPSIQVLGTNGKTSTTRMTAAILEEHGLRVGVYTSPHLISWRERIMLDGRVIEPEAFAAAVERASHAAAQVNRTLGEDDHVTQFELLTAAGLWAMAEQGVDVAVVEAGLGGRYDATTVIAADVVALTNVGLEHTRWLGPTVADIAEEKLAAVSPGARLVLGAGLDPAAEAVAERVARTRPAELIRAEPLPEGLDPAAAGLFQRQNLALARGLAQAHLASLGRALSAAAVERAAAGTLVAGRMQMLPGEPPVLLDGAHNPDAVRALAASLPELLAGRPLGLVMGVLEDKDAGAMLRTLLPLAARAWFTAPPSSRALPPAALESRARQLGFLTMSCEPRPARALAAARSWAAEAGGLVLATGSVYLVGELLGSSGSLAGAEAQPRSSAR